MNAIFQDIFIFSKDVGVVHRQLYDLLKKTKAPPFASLYVVKKQTRYKEVLADHNTLLRLVVAYDDGRVVDRPRILRHELMEISEVETDLSSEIKCPVQVYSNT